MNFTASGNDSRNVPQGRHLELELESTDEEIK